MSKPFSLTCTDCAARSEFGRRRDATAAGWVDIVKDDGPSWNYVGTCPACQVDQARNDAECLVRGVWWANDPAEAKSQAAHPRAVNDRRNPAKVFDDVCEIGKRLKVAEANLRKWRAKGRGAAPVAAASPVPLPDDHDRSRP